MNIISEYEQREQFLKNYSQKSEKLFYEVPIFSRSIDVVKCDFDSDILTAIEFKLFKWKKCLEQVVNVSIAFDYIEICIMEPKTIKGQDAILSECSKLGVGVYFTNFINEYFTIKHVLKPEKVIGNWEVQRLNVKRYLMGGV